MTKSETWEYNGAVFRKCPKCAKAIPDEWKEHKICGWKKEIVADPLPQKDVREFKPSSDYSDKGDEIGRMSAVKTAAEVLGDSTDLAKLREMTLIIHNWIKTGSFDVGVPVEEVK